MAPDPAFLNNKRAAGSLWQPIVPGSNARARLKPRRAVVIASAARAAITHHRSAWAVVHHAARATRAVAVPPLLEPMAPLVEPAAHMSQQRQAPLLVVVERLVERVGGIDRALECGGIGAQRIGAL